MKEMSVYGLLVLLLCGTWELNLRLERASDVQSDPRGRVVHAGRLSSQSLRNVLIFAGMGVQEAAAAASTAAAGGEDLEKDCHYQVVFSTGGTFMHLTLTGDDGRVVVLPAESGGYRAVARPPSAAPLT